MAASMLHERVQDFVLGENDSILGDISHTILGKESSILELVEILGPHLTSTEKHVRGRGTRLLAETLHRLPVGFLSSKEVEVLSNFFCDRIKDHHSVTPHVLRGMQALAILPTLPDVGVQQMLSAIFTEVQVQTLTQGDRRTVFTIIAHFLAKRLKVLQDMTDFVLNYIQAIDGEKDPRNLVICFTSTTVIAQNFSIGIFAEEIFEVVGCYFPIDFTPPANDPHGVTRESLVLGLRGCLASTPQFAQYCVPLLIEKLTSSVPSARIDSLLTLAQCALTYGPAGLMEYLPSLAFNIRREVFSATDPELEKAALKAIQGIVQALSQPGHETMLKGFLDDLYKDCQRHLCEPELKLMYPSARVLQEAARGSVVASAHVLALVLPLLLEQYQKHQQVTLRKKVIDIMLGFLRVVNLTKSNEVSHVLDQHKDEIFGLLVALLSNSDIQLRCLALQGISLYGFIPPLVEEARTTLVASHITNSLLHDAEEDVRHEAVTNLSELTGFHPETVKEQLGSVIANITNEPMEVTSDGDHGSCVASKQFLLASLPSLAKEPRIVEFVLPPLFDYLEKLQADDPSPEALETGCWTCACIRAIVHRSHDSSHEYLVSHVLKRCLTLAVRGAVESTEHRVLSHHDVLTHIAATIRTIVQNMKNSAELASAVCHLFMHGDLGGISVDIADAAPFRPLEVSSDPRQTQCVCILQAVVCSLRDQSVLTELHPLLERLWPLCLESCDSFTHTAAMRCYAGLLNKLQPDSKASLLAMKCKEDLQSVISSESASVDHRKRAVLLWCWLCKALTLRGHEAQSGYQQQLIQLLSDTDLGPEAADGFRIILEEASDVLTTQQHAVIRMLYHQRLFETTRKQLVEGYTQASYGQKLHFLTALSHYLNFVPKEVLRGELPNLLPLLLQALCYEDTSLQLATVATLTDLALNDAALLASHTEELIPRLIGMTEHKPNMKVRVSALKCLGLLSSLPRHLIYPHQNTVVGAVGKCLNDHKRLVRRAAADVRMMWYLLETQQ